MLPPLAVVPSDVVEEGLQEARAVWSSRTGPRSTHCGDERRVQSCPPPLPCQAGDEGCLRLGFRVGCKGGVYRPEQHGGIVSGSLLNDAVANRLDLDTRKMTVAARRHGLSVVLVALQFGIYLGSENRIAAMLDRTQADLGVVPLGTMSFDDLSLLPGHEKHAILSTRGVAGMEELAVGFVAWRKLSGAAMAASLVGSDARNNRSLPCNVAEGSIAELSSPNALVVEATYVKELDILKRGERAEIDNMQVAARVVTKCIGSFTALPYAFATIALARQLLDATPDQSPYELVCVVPGYTSVLSAVMSCGILLGLLLICFSHDPLIVMTTHLALLLLALAVGMCVFAAISAIFKVTRIDPAVVFSR